jgi:hypothetical protein
MILKYRKRPGLTTANISLFKEGLGAWGRDLIKACTFKTKAGVIIPPAFGLF